MLSQTVEYALRAMVCLANVERASQTRTQLVAQTQVPAAYLAKVMKQLCRAGLVRAQRGLHGGFCLTRPAEQISLLAVVNAVEPLQRIKHCPLRLPNHGTNLCPLHRRVDDALAAVEAAFATTTLADIVADKTGSIPLCSDGSDPCVTLVF
jgi:Rrf2 family nitric oxide-sensitive transcriptional repressor